MSEVGSILYAAKRGGAPAGTNYQAAALFNPAVYYFIQNIEGLLIAGVAVKRYNGGFPGSGKGHIWVSVECFRLKLLLVKGWGQGVALLR